ncbi:unnamed protein product [Ectocarpus sp. 8 AP-2014]
MSDTESMSHDLHPNNTVRSSSHQDQDSAEAFGAESLPARTGKGVVESGATSEERNSTFVAKGQQPAGVAAETGMPPRTEEAAAAAGEAQAEQQPAAVAVEKATPAAEVEPPGKVQVTAGGAEEASSEGEDDDDDFDWGAAKHIFVLSNAGKPVFSLSGDEQRLSTLMSLIQGMLSLCADCDNGDEMESISAGSRRFVFLKRGNLVLVGVSSSLVDTASGDEGGEGGEGTGKEEDEAAAAAPECESFMRLQLEYLYASILFLLTSKVQGIFLKSPGYDLRGLLGGADASLRGIIELAEPSRGRGRMLAGGVETVWMDPAIRSRVARNLQAAQTASAPSGALYAVWLCGEKLVALAQPRAPSHHLSSRDLLLLVNYVATQPALRNAESWTPVCFPRFQKTGYLYAYIGFLEDPPSSTLPQSPPQGNSDQNSPPAQHSGATAGKGSIADENEGRRGGSASADGGTQSNGSGSHSIERDSGTEAGGAAGDSCVILVSVESSSEQFQAFRRTRSALESRFRSALGTHWDRYLGSGAKLEREGILTKFCTQMKALHFHYCLRGKQGGAPCVTQCLSSPFVDHELASNPAAQHRVWGYYTRAALRLRRGSCQEGRVFCRRRFEGNNGYFGGGGGDGRGSGSPAEEGKGASEEELATALFESDPVHSLAYEVGDEHTVVSLFGKRDGGAGGGGRWVSSSSAGAGRLGGGDELHACFPSSVSPEDAYKAAVRLTAIVRRDRDWLFLTGTGAAK